MKDQERERDTRRNLFGNNLDSIVCPPICVPQFEFGINLRQS